MKLEDGEDVLMLRGARKKPSDAHGRARWRSSQPHAGVWGKGIGYVLVPSDRATNRRAKLALAFDPELQNRSGDVEVLLLGPTAAIERLITAGPNFCRVQRRRIASPAQRAAGMLGLAKAAEKRASTAQE